MKKNLMNAALLGLLIATPACSFVSCKDYDDDFNKVNKRLDGLEAVKTQINTEITSLKSDLQKANEKATQLEAKLAEYATKTELQNGLAAKADKKELETAVNNLSAKIAEVAQLETRIQALETAKAELTALVNAKVDQKAYDAKVADIEGRLTAAQSKATLAADKANTLEQTLNTLKNKVDNQLVALDKFNEKVAALEGKDADLQKKLDELKNTVTEKVTALKNDVKTLQDAGYQTAAQVEAKVNPVADRVTQLEKALDMLRVAKVTSLVLQPDHFEGGIEGIVSTDFAYQEFKKLDWANEKGVVEFKTEGEATGDNLVKNFAQATYHVNPSGAKVDDNKDNFAFVSLRPTTRTSGSEPVTVTSVEYDAAKGELYVGFQNNLPAEGTNEDGKKEINIVALSYTEKDGTTARSVVSDYARVVADKYDKLRIGKATDDVVLAPEFLKKAGVDNLTGIAVPKEKEIRTFTVLNDGTPAQLSEQVRSYGENAGQNTPIDENAAHESDLTDAGFKYKYALVKDGADDKSTDAFTIDPNTGELKVEFDAEKPFQHVGKKAVVRVTLVDANGKVASVGYFYARVAAPAKVVAHLVVNDELKVVCDKNSEHPALFVDLEPLTKYLAKNFGMAEADVWKNGAPDNFTITTPGGEHDQYTVKEGVADPVPVDKRLGKLLRIAPDAEGKNILKWSGLTEEKVANLRRAGESVSVILQVIKKNDSKNVVLYFEVKWAPKSIQAQPEVEFTGKPVANWWYQNQNVAAEQEQRMHVSIDGQNGFSHDLTKGFLPGSVKAPALDATKYPTDIKTTASAWKFVEPRVKQAKGTDGKAYKLSVSEDGTKFLAEEMKDGNVVTGATKNEVAVITETGVITYQNNPVSKALLNYAGYNELRDGQTLTARVAYVTTSCAGKKVLNVTEATKKYSEFDVKFIRPLNVNYTGRVTFGDANQARQEAEINFEGAITDWRNVSKLADLKTAYGALAVGFAPEDEWTTNLNDGNLETLKLKETFGSTYGVSVAADPAGTDVADGEFKGYKEYVFGTYPKLKYETNTANLKQFTIRIPVYVKYHWGEIKSHIDVLVGKTLNQGNARRK